MKTTCPNCSQRLEYGDDFAGTTAPCPKCGAMVAFPSLTFCPDCGANVSRLAEVCPDCGAELSLPKLTVCPDCGAKVSRRAETCPQCGAPLSEPKSAPASTAPVNVAPGKVSQSATNVILGMVAVVVAIHGLVFAWMDRSAPIAVVGFLILLGGAVAVEKSWRIKCPCGYYGAPIITGRAGCAVEGCLFCLAIIPWLLYVALHRQRYVCPKCGREGFR